MSFHAEVLTERQRKALRLLGPKSAAHGFYLAGGTAIALHLGHRRSVDFDWFLADRIKFGIEDIGHVRYSLAYFDDADAERMPRMIWKMNWKEIKETITAWVRAL